MGVLVIYARSRPLTCESCILVVASEGLKVMYIHFCCPYVSAQKTCDGLSCG